MTNQPQALTFSGLSRLSAACALALGGLLLGGHAHADNHALIMTIDYAGTGNQLPPAGIEADGRLASQIAEGMGVPRQNIRWMKNRELTQRGIADAIQQLATERVREGDKVFLFYSGHGAQVQGINGSKCTEGLVGADVKIVPDSFLQSALEVLSAKASQVVMLNDSCFSGGQATKSLTRGADGAAPKFAVVAKAGSASDENYQCGNAVNAKALSRSLGVVAAAKSARMLYIAAAADNEVAWAAERGSAATVAWARCLQDRNADRDRNGIIDGEELRQCSQAAVNAGGAGKQTITVLGEARLPMSFVAGPSSGPSGGGAAPVQNAAGALESLRRAADPTIRVGIQVNNPRLKINQDLLDFSVSVDRPGYLYLLHLGTDGKYYQLFPNDRDSSNQVQAGTHRFPRASWALQAHGPAGRSYVMAYLSSTPRDFGKELSKDGGFVTGQANAATVRSLGVVAMESRFGASQVAEIAEVN